MLKKLNSTFASILLFSSLSAMTQEQVKPYMQFNQGWSAQDRAEAYTISEGSELIPLKWFLNLEDANSKTKLVQKLTSYGFVYSQEKNLTINPNQFPIGVAVVEDQETKHLYNESSWVGINCTACHTGFMSIGGKNVLIEGAPSLFRIQNFENDIVSAVKMTLADSEKLDRFFANTKTPDTLKASVIKNLHLFSDEFGAWVERGHHYIDRFGKEIPYGPGRVDGLGGPANDLICRLTDRMGDAKLNASVTDPRNCRGSNPAVSLSHLWGMADQEWVQWSGSVHAALARNYGQTTGTYGKNWMEYNKLGLPMLRSTARIPSLHKIFDIFKKLKSPEWNDLVSAGVAAPLDADRIQRGSKLYQKNCVSCHAVQPEFSFPNAFGNRYWKSDNYTDEQLGVDPYYTAAHSQRRAFLPAQLKTEFATLFQNNIAQDGTVSATQLRGLQILKSSAQAFLVSKYPDNTPTITNVLNPLRWPNPVDFTEFTSCRNVLHKKDQPGFRARSLEGIGFTAPYLHNGSVPTLDDLLKPHNERPQKFFVGCHKYDIEKMGFACGKDDEGSELYDTLQQSNSNAGHEYGYLLNASERGDLIEYIKSIKNPSKPFRLTNCY